MSSETEIIVELKRPFEGCEIREVHLWKSKAIMLRETSPSKELEGKHTLPCMGFAGSLVGGAL
jgi:hypothetical protein